MPPKVKVTKNDIIEISLDLIRQNGYASLNARAIASSLGCSTQPIFSNFATMDELFDAVLRAAADIYFAFLEKEASSEKYPRYKAFGMAYIRFAKEEKELFKLLFMRNRHGEALSPASDFEASVEMIMSANGVSYETASRMHLEIWSCVHGIGTMLATSFLDLDWELISDMISDVYYGLRARHVSEVQK